MSFRNYDPPKEQWFTQNLDHFNPVEGRTWKQVIYFFLFFKFYFQFYQIQLRIKLYKQF